MKNGTRINALLKALKKAYPEAACALNFSSPLELLVATILSAQCTDKRVNIVTPGLFKKYPTAGHYAKASPSALEGEIRSTGFYRQKAKWIREMARTLVDRFQGRVPKTMEEMLQLPGVARKTANVVLGTAFGIPSGVVVDTHVRRLSERMGLSKETNPVKIEQDLMRFVSQKDWIWFGHAMITHGRQVCVARAPKCPDCPVNKWCPYPAKTQKN